MKRTKTKSAFLMTVVKRKLVSLGITQDEAAKRCGVSLPTLKRWLSGEGVSLENLFLLSDAVGISFDELSDVMRAEFGKTTEYTEKQEALFVRYPSCLAFFDMLLSGKSVSEIKKKSGISEESVRRHLQLLEKVDLIERGLKDKITVKIRGEVKWRKNGALAKKFKGAAFAEFLKQCNDEPGSLIFKMNRLSSADAARAKQMIKDLRDFLSVAESRARFEKSGSESFGVVLALAKFEWTALSEVTEI